MTHCIDGCHVYLPHFDICICGQSRWGVSGTKSPNAVSGMIPKPYTIPYVPNPHHPRYQGPQQQPANEVPLSTFKAAVDVNATHLSADGSKAYREHYGNARVCFWDDEAKGFGSWFPYLSDLPEDAVKVDGAEE